MQANSRSTFTVKQADSRVMRLVGACSAAAAFAIVFNLCGPLCLAENHGLNGVKHPLVSIELESNPLKLTHDGEIELTFHLRGLLPGFRYSTEVHECDENGPPGRQSNHTVVSMDRDAASSPSAPSFDSLRSLSNEGTRERVADRQATKCMMGLRLLNAEQTRYRLFIMVWVSHDVRPSREALVAQWDVTVTLCTLQSLSLREQRTPAGDGKTAGAQAADEVFAMLSDISDGMTAAMSEPDHQYMRESEALLSREALVAQRDKNVRISHEPGARTNFSAAGPRMEADTQSASEASVPWQPPHHQLHGVNHPSVTIQLGSNPLRSTGTGLMNLTFHLRGLLPGFTYNISVNQFDIAWRTWREYELQSVTIQAPVQTPSRSLVVKSIDGDASSKESMHSQQVTMALSVLHSRQKQFRFFILVWDAYEALPSREALVAQRDVTVALSYELSVRPDPALGSDTIAPRSLQAELGADERAEDLRDIAQDFRGDHHPAVSIKFYDPALSYQCDNFGNIKSMEVHAWIEGCEQGLHYRVLMKEEEKKIWFEDFALPQGVSSFRVLAVFHHPEPKVSHRFWIALMDTHPGLDEDVRLLGAREAVLKAPSCPSNKELLSFSSRTSELFSTCFPTAALEARSGPSLQGFASRDAPTEEPVPPQLCIVVPFRDGCGWHGKGRSRQLDYFLRYMTKWLTARGHSSFRFVITEQSQQGLFNKGILFNIGALAAFSEGCEQIVFHDVDQLPLNPKNNYAYGGSPTHLCTWSTQWEFCPHGIGMRPHLGGALMMSRSDYVAVNGYSNKYLRWGLEDDDMYHRMSTVFETIDRLPQEVGAYEAMHHDRYSDEYLHEAPEYSRSEDYLDTMRFDTEDARNQLESDGLRQTCQLAEVLHIENDFSKRMTYVTSDLLDNSSCSNAEANATKLRLDEGYRRDPNFTRTCFWLLKESGLLRIAPAKRLCTRDDRFCVNTWTQAGIRNNIDRFDQMRPHDKRIDSDLSMKRPQAKDVFNARKTVLVTPLLEWFRLFNTTISSSFQSLHQQRVSHFRSMSDPYTRPRPYLHIGHAFMMGWNESMAYLRMLIRNKVPFSITRYGDGEIEILCNRSHHNKEWSWSPHQYHADSFRRLLMQPFKDAQSEEQIMMIGLPLTFCAEGIWNVSMGGGGRRDLMQQFFQPPLSTDARIADVPANRFLYSWQFGNLNYNATFYLIETLVMADWPILVICNRDRVMDQKAPAWVSGVLSISTNSVQEMISNFDSVTRSIRALAEAVDGAAFLFAAGPISNVAISVMHRANPSNIYVDVGGSLDFVLNNIRTRDFHPHRNDDSHFVRAGGALISGQNCTETRWVMRQRGFTPVPSEKD